MTARWGLMLCEFLSYIVRRLWVCVSTVEPSDRLGGLSTEPAACQEAPLDSVSDGIVTADQETFHSIALLPRLLLRDLVSGSALPRLSISGAGRDLKMPAYDVIAIKSEEVAERTMAFHFEKPVGFAFTAGQFISITLIDPPEIDTKGDTRAFSIASAPYERDLMITTRMRDTAFKRTLKKLTHGERVQIHGPFGSLTLRDVAKPAVFLAGGIGITPFRSILLQAAQQRHPQRTFLFYCNRRAEDAAFLDELKQLEKVNPNYKCVATLTKLPESEREWDGEKGYISRTMLLKFIHDLQEPIYYIAGPPGMVLSMQEEIKNRWCAESPHTCRTICRLLN